jgi:DNA mismatch repair ATPase MutS
MKAFLMHRDRDFDAAQEPPPAGAALVQDLELGTLFRAMAGEDAFLREVAQTAVLNSLTDVDAIRYRQAILRDCLSNASVVRRLYALAVETIEEEKKHYWGLLSRPGSILHRSVTVLHILVGALRRLRSVAETETANFESEGFQTLFAMLRRELDEPYLQSVETHIERLRFRHGPLISWQLRTEIAGAGHVLRRPKPDDRPLGQRLLTARRPSYTFHVHERDEAGGRIVTELRDRGIAFVANAAAQSVDHIVSFFRMLRTELAFYIGALNLHERLTGKDLKTCLPDPLPLGERQHEVRGLYDPCLALVTDRAVIANDLLAANKNLLIVTGANEGGKTTWLRAIGVAQLMMECGLFVAADAFRANLASALFVHFRREEDAAMQAGKFEEELRRISGIVDHLKADGLVLFNESLQSTNEREGSEIGRQIIAALLASRIKVVFVTHMYDLAGGLGALYLRAERLEDGRRTFRIIPGAPLPTSYGRDVFDEIFGSSRPKPERTRARGAGALATPVSARAGPEG